MNKYQQQILLRHSKLLQYNNNNYTNFHVKNTNDDEEDDNNSNDKGDCSIDDTNNNKKQCYIDNDYNKQRESEVVYLDNMIRKHEKLITYKKHSNNSSNSRSSSNSSKTGECRIKKAELKEKLCQRNKTSSIKDEDYNINRISCMKSQSIGYNNNNQAKDIINHDDKDSKISGFTSSQNITRQGDENNNNNNNISNILSIHQNGQQYSPSSLMNMSIAKSFIEKFENCEIIENTSCVLKKTLFDPKDIPEISLIQDKPNNPQSNNSQFNPNHDQIKLKEKHETKKTGQAVNQLEDKFTVIDESSSRLSTLGNDENFKPTTRKKRNYCKDEKMMIMCSNIDNVMNKENTNMKKAFMDDFQNLKEEVVTIQNNLKCSEAYNKKLEDALVNQSMQINKMLQNFMNLQVENECLKKNFTNLSKSISTKQQQNPSTIANNQDLLLMCGFKRDLELVVAKKVIKFQAEEMTLQKKKFENIIKNQDSVIQDLRKIIEKNDLFLNKQKSNQNLDQEKISLSSISANLVTNVNIPTTARSNGYNKSENEEKPNTTPNITKRISTKHRNSIEIRLPINSITNSKNIHSLREDSNIRIQTHCNSTTSYKYHSAERSKMDIPGSCKPFDEKIQKPEKSTINDDERLTTQMPIITGAGDYTKTFNKNDDFVSDDVAYLKRMKEKMTRLKKPINNENTQLTKLNSDISIKENLRDSAKHHHQQQQNIVNGSLERHTESHSHSNKTKNNMPNSDQDYDYIEFDKILKGISPNYIQNEKQDLEYILNQNHKESIMNYEHKLDEQQSLLCPITIVPSNQEMSFDISFLKENQLGKKPDMEIASFNLSPIRESQQNKHIKIPGSANYPGPSNSTIHQQHQNPINNSLMYNIEHPIIPNDTSITDSSINLNSNIIYEKISPISSSNNTPLQTLIPSKSNPRAHEYDSEKLIKVIYSKDTVVNNQKTPIDSVPNSEHCKPHLNFFKKDPNKIPISDNIESYKKTTIQDRFYNKNGNNDNNPKSCLNLQEAIEYKTPKHASTTTSRLRRRELDNFSNANLILMNDQMSRNVENEMSKLIQKKANSVNNSENKTSNVDSNPRRYNNNSNKDKDENISQFRLQDHFSREYSDNISNNNNNNTNNMNLLKNGSEKYFEVKSSSSLAKRNGLSGSGSRSKRDKNNFNNNNNGNSNDGSAQSKKENNPTFHWKLDAVLVNNIDFNEENYYPEHKKPAPEKAKVRTHHKTKSRHSRHKRIQSNTTDLIASPSTSIILKNESQNSQNMPSNIFNIPNGNGGIANPNTSGLIQMNRSPTVNQLQKEECNLKVINMNENHSTPTLRHDRGSNTGGYNNNHHHHGGGSGGTGCGSEYSYGLQQQQQQYHDKFNKILRPPSRNQTPIHKKNDHMSNISGNTGQKSELLMDFHHLNDDDDNESLYLHRDIEKNFNKKDRYCSSNSGIGDNRESSHDKHNKRYKNHKMNDIVDNITEFNMNDYPLTNKNTKKHIQKHGMHFEYPHSILENDLIYRNNNAIPCLNNQRYTNNRKENQSSSSSSGRGINTNSNIILIDPIVFNDITNNHNQIGYGDYSNPTNNNNATHGGGGYSGSGAGGYGTITTTSNAQGYGPNNNDHTKRSGKKGYYQDKESYYNPYKLRDQKDYEREKDKSDRYERNREKEKMERLERDIYEKVKKERMEREKERERERERLLIYKDENNSIRHSKGTRIPEHRSIIQHNINNDKNYNRNMLIDCDSSPINKSNEPCYFNNISSIYPRESKKYQ